MNRTPFAAHPPHFAPAGPPQGRRRVAIVLMEIMLLAPAGCAHSQWARLRSNPFNPLTPVLELNSRSGPQPTDRTLQLLRRNDLDRFLREAPEKLVEKAQELAHREPTAENIYALAEIAYVGAKRLEEQRREDRALDLYGTALANAYFYLFDDQLELERNPFDPRFRRACDLYNNSLEAGLRYLNRQHKLKPGARHLVQTPQQNFEIEIATRGTWHEKNFCELKFTSDFQVEELRNVYRTYGLGVPLIAEYQAAADRPRDRFYPPGMTFPVTAFMRIAATRSGDALADGVTHRCVIELHDPLESSHVLVDGEPVPLETDLTTPLAYALDNPAFRQANDPHRGIRAAEESLAASGVYLLEPFDAEKIPVVMIHGFWSSLVTWMEMFNDLRGLRDIRDRYQFWFYLYPTGSPYWYTAARLRDQLLQARTAFDPQGTAPALDQMVLVGHSMGGLIAKLQVLDSGDEIWQLVSPQPLEQLQGDAVALETLRDVFFFQPNPSVQRVVTIATPFGGSSLSNQATQWLGRQLIEVPDAAEVARRTLLSRNPQAFPSTSLLHDSTSVRGLAVHSAMLQVLESLPLPDGVAHHNIVGRVDDLPMLKTLVQGSDGVIKAEHATSASAISEIMVDADHVKVHRHPRAILEVRRILLEHAAGMSP